MSTLPEPEIDLSTTLKITKIVVVVFQEWYGHRGSSEPASVNIIDLTWQAYLLVRCPLKGCSRWCQRPLCTGTQWILSPSPLVHTLLSRRTPSVVSQPRLYVRLSVQPCRFSQRRTHCSRQIGSVTRNNIAAVNLQQNHCHHHRNICSMPTT